MTTNVAHAEQYMQVLGNLANEPTLQGTQIGVCVRDGVAVLFGCVSSQEHKLVAERAALRVPGILAVAVEITLEERDPRRRSDADVARAVADYLRDERQVPLGAIRGCVERARVTLTGAVDLFHQRDAVERGIRNLHGVRGVINLVSVRPPESQGDIHAKVRSAVIRELATLDPEASTGSRHDESEATMVQGKKILIVDDDDDFRASLKPVLESEGYVAIEARSGHEGLALLLEHDPDLIVLDIMMESNVEGYGINQAIKYQDKYEKYRRTPILMVSSIQETPDDRFPRAPEVEMIRPDAYFTKPLDMDRFLEVVGRVVARRGRK